MRRVFLAIMIGLLTGCSNSADIAKNPKVSTPLTIEQSSPQVKEKQSYAEKTKLVTHPRNSETKMEMKAKGFIPNRLRIPSIDLDTVIETVGITTEGSMDVPKAFNKVGILSPWTKPGENGSAVIAGHFDHYTGPAIFYHLKKLKPGDQVFVSNTNNDQLIYVVKEITSFNTKEAPLEKIFGESVTSHLNLITCSGKFNKKTQEHAKRLVVFTELIK
ncbi:class F sortase [Brevibacillus laterosporus]|nr:class F sortase [Brevibacillus laterosporus]RAP30472.1 hypothetical protein C2W64_01668 [Brevibacillus laterosporus]TPG73219.1 class F sortase [Brevibacillus laterosporus]TPG88988.1 class F sortase [Brevibacillus laterosporus]